MKYCASPICGLQQKFIKLRYPQTMQRQPCLASQGNLWCVDRRTLSLCWSPYLVAGEWTHFQWLSMHADTSYVYRLSICFLNLLNRRTSGHIASESLYSGWTVSNKIQFQGMTMKSFLSWTNWLHGWRLRTSGWKCFLSNRHSKGF